METNKIIFLTLALFMGAAHRQTIAMEATPELKLDSAGAKGLRIALREIIKNIPNKRKEPDYSPYYGPYRQKLKDISSLIQTRLVNPGNEIVGLICDKNIGEELYYIAEINKQQATMNWLHNAGLITNKFIANEQKRQEELIKEFKNGENPQYRFWSILEGPLKTMDFKSLEFWLSHGADINMQNPYGSFAGNTPINNFTVEILLPISTHIIMFLLEQSADVNTQTKGGNTALFNVTANEREIRHSGGKIIKELLKRGASPYVKNKDGFSLQDYLRGNTSYGPKPERLVNYLYKLGVAEQLGLEPKTKGLKNENK